MPGIAFLAQHQHEIVGALVVLLLALSTWRGYRHITPKGTVSMSTPEREALRRVVYSWLYQGGELTPELIDDPQLLCSVKAEVLGVHLDEHCGAQSWREEQRARFEDDEAAREDEFNRGLR